MGTTAESMALVPFDYAIAGAAGRSMEHRTFVVGGKTITIKQDYKPDGKGGTAIGFGANVYNSSFVLAEYVCRHHAETIKGARVVELGCGTGLVSIACGAFGSQEVIATDGDTALLELTAHNISLNGVESCVRTHTVMWGDQEAHAAMDPPMDVVLAADVAAFVYQEAFELLVCSLRALCHNPSEDRESLVLLAYERRHGDEKRFFEVLAKEFHVETVERDKLHPDFQSEQHLGMIH